MEKPMRLMMFLKATKDTEAGKMPSAKLLAEMGQLMEDMSKAGILLGGDGLKPSVHGKRVSFANGKVTSWTDGPFAETKEVIAGYCLIQVKDWDEARPWLERFAAVQGNGDCELRPIFEPTDFPSDIFPPEQVEKELKLREKLGEKNTRA
jgi:hypothetical protein